jgi:hypothetical protein
MAVVQAYDHAWRVVSAVAVMGALASLVCGRRRLG